MPSKRSRKASGYQDPQAEPKPAPEAATRAREALDVDSLELKIRKGVPMPGDIRHSALHEVLKKMELGDCVDLPFPRFNRASVAAMGYRIGIRLTTRLLILHPDGSGEMDTLRVWRAK